MKKSMPRQTHLYSHIFSTSSVYGAFQRFIIHACMYVHMYVVAVEVGNFYNLTATELFSYFWAMFSQMFLIWDCEINSGRYLASG